MAKILVVPPKSISLKDKAEAAKAGFVVIEVSDPTKVLIIDEHQIIRGNDLAMVALDTLCEAGTDVIQASFTRRLRAKLKQNEKQ